MTLDETPVAVPLRGARAGQTGSIEDRASAARALAHARAVVAAERERARAEGLAAGRAEAHAELAGAIASAHTAARELHEAREAAIAQLTESAASLSLEIAAKVIRAELEARPDLVDGVVRGAIRRAAERGRLVVHVNPADLDLIRAAAPEIFQTMGGIDDLKIVDEPRVARGGCIVETPGGDVDASVESQLERIGAALRGPVDDALG